MADFGTPECRDIWPFFGVATVGSLLRADIPDATRVATDAPGPILVRGRDPTQS
jgi:hypothetical protein